MLAGNNASEMKSYFTNSYKYQENSLAAKLYNQYKTFSNDAQNTAYAGGAAGVLAGVLAFFPLTQIAAAIFASISVALDLAAGGLEITAGIYQNRAQTVASSAAAYLGIASTFGGSYKQAYIGSYEHNETKDPFAGADAELTNPFFADSLSEPTGVKATSTLGAIYNS